MGTLKLLPAMGALREYPDLEHDIPLDFAGTDSGAIAYPDGHPSEVAALPDYFLSPSSKPKTTPTIKPSEVVSYAASQALALFFKRTTRGPGGRLAMSS